MNTLVDVRDIHGVMHTRAFDAEEAVRAKAYLERTLPELPVGEHAKTLRAIDSLDKIINPMRAYEEWLS